MSTCQYVQVTVILIKVNLLHVFLYFGLALKETIFSVQFQTFYADFVILYRSVILLQFKHCMSARFANIKFVLPQIRILYTFANITHDDEPAVVF